jgi:hypothetical protein
MILSLFFVVFIFSNLLVQFTSFFGEVKPLPQLYLVVTDINHTNPITIGIFENMTNGNSASFTIQQSGLALLKGPSNFHKEGILESGVVGIEFNLDVHCVNRLSEFRKKSTGF